MAISIEEFDLEGFCPLVSFNGWRVAVANFCERLLEENISKLERHLKTDEVFILLEGEAVLHIGMEMQRVPMQTGKIYNVHCGEWHAISMLPNTKVAIIENDDTSPANTDYQYIRRKKCLI